MLRLQGKKILLGITGAIAAYKTISLIRLYKKEGADVKVILSPNALQFVTIKTLETISQNKVYIDCFEEEHSTLHISLEDWADIFVVAPITFNTISKIRNGICDNLLTSVAGAIYGTKIPVILAPSMNCNMWNSEILSENIRYLSERCTILEPEVGFLACGEEGKGRLIDINIILEKTVEIIKENLPLRDKKIIVTSGGTREYIDPVRVITNLSSGKMGLALADCAYSLGAEVELITTNDIVRDYKVKKVNTAQEMKEMLDADFPGFDCLIMASAVADYRIKNYNESKISGKDETLTLEFVKNPDILAEICKTKRENQIVAGFCLSTENLEENAKEKIRRKGCDYIVANRADIALGQDKNEVIIYDKNLNEKKFELDYKENIAKKILELIYD